MRFPARTPGGNSSTVEHLCWYGTNIGTVLGACIVILLVREIDARPGTTSVFIHGPLDALAHLMTGLMIAIGIRSLRLPVPVWAVLIGSLVPDVGHVLSWRDVMETVAGSSRTGTHSALMLIAIATIGFVDWRRANIWLGIAIGGLTHLWRDMGTGTIPLLWPFDLAVDGTTFSRYMIALVGGSVAMIGSGMLLDIYRYANRHPERH